MWEETVFKIEHRAFSFKMNKYLTITILRNSTGTVLSLKWIVELESQIYKHTLLSENVSPISAIWITMKGSLSRNRLLIAETAACHIVIG